MHLLRRRFVALIPTRRTQPIDRTEHCLTILNAYPYAPGHVMVAPARHVAALEDLHEDEMLDTMRLARRVDPRHPQGDEPDGFNVGLQPGQGRRRRNRRSPALARRSALERRHELHAAAGRHAT